MAAPTRVSVIGVGHLGKIHARILDEHEQAELVSLVDVDEENVEEQAAKYQVPYYVHTDEMLKEEEPDAVIVSAPTEVHYELAHTCLQANVHVLVEKPITQRIDHARELVERAESVESILQVGHVERFNPAVSRLLELVDDPKFIECDRLSPFRFRSADIDVVQDVMIHDLDIIRALVPGRIKSVEAVGTSVVTPFADIANARIKSSSGCISNLSASRISLDSVRKLRVFTPDTYYSLDYSEKELHVYTASERLKQFDLTDIQHFQEKSSSGDLDTKRLFEECLEVEQVVPASDRQQEPLKLEQDEFLASIRNNDPPETSGTDGLEALKLAKEIREACEEQDA